MSHGRKAIDSAVSLDTLGIPWKGTPREWGSINRNLMHVCNVKGEVFDSSGLYLYRLSPVEKLGEGTFGKVDSYKCVYKDTEGQSGQSGGGRQPMQSKHSIVAIKRPKFPEVDLFMEALFQWRIRDCLEEYGLEFSIPQVYSIMKFKQSGDIWFSMKSYKATLLSAWCLQNIKKDGKLFTLLLLQISLVLEVMENVLRVDHRDLKVNNIMVVDEKCEIDVGQAKKMVFPFHIVFIDFGYACAGKLIDIKTSDGIPPIDMCPKEGRDMFQILVSLWRIQALREILDQRWGTWIRSRIESGGAYLRLAECAMDLNWLYSVTENTAFRAPLCAPSLIIQDCMRILEC
jgi:serine/threonine protein kinase